MDAADRRAFPNAIALVRVGTANWNQGHNKLLQRLADIVKHRFQETRGVTLPEMDAALQPAPRLQDGESYVYLLFGSQPVLVDSEQQASLDVKGLIWEPLATTRVSKRANLVVDF